MTVSNLKQSIQSKQHLKSWYNQLGWLGVTAHPLIHQIKKKGENHMKQYYLASKKVGTDIQVECWHGESDRAGFLFNSYDYVLALGTRKPRSINKEDIKEF